MKNKLKYITALVLLLTFSAAFAVFAFAEEYTDQTQNASEDASENFLSKVYEEIAAYTSEILCSLTFAGSLVLALAYKKGLLPLVEKSLAAIGGAVTKIKENTRENAEKSSALGENIERKLTGTQELLDRLAERIKALEETLGENLENESTARIEARQLKIVVDTQIDMLRDIFMSSALPQYQKDSVGERIAKMKEAIAENADTN